MAHIQAHPLPKDYETTGAGPGDYMVLHRYVTERRPTHVLELGSGVTTAVLAEAMHAVGAGKLTSVDHNQKFTDEATDFLPTDLASRVEFVVEPCYGGTYRGIDVTYYVDVPIAPYDMMFVDGPFTLAGNRHFPSTDIIRVVERLTTPVDVIIDKRLTTLHWMSAWLDCPVVYDPDLRLGVIGGLTSGMISKQSPTIYDHVSRVRVGSAIEALGMKEP